MNQVSYVSSVCNKYSQAKLNRTIQSLNCFIDCSTPDETEQDYGLISYCGEINVGTVIKGNKAPRKSGIPIMYSTVCLGTLDKDGKLKITNNCQAITSCTTSICYCDITLTYNPSAASSDTSYYCEGEVTETKPVVSCITDCCEYSLIEVSSYTCTNQVCEQCVFCCAFPGSSVMEGNNASLLSALGITNYGTICSYGLTCAANGYCWCDGCLCYSSCYIYCIETSNMAAEVTVNCLFGPYLAGYENGHIKIINSSNLPPINNTITACVCHSSGSCWCCELTLDKETSSYCVSSTGNFSLSTNPTKIVTEYLCRCLKPIEGCVCIEAYYY